MHEKYNSVINVHDEPYNATILFYGCATIVIYWGLKFTSMKYLTLITSLILFIGVASILNPVNCHEDFSIEESNQSVDNDVIDTRGLVETIIEIWVFDEKTGDPLHEACIYIFNSITGRYWTGHTDENGYLSIDLIKGGNFEVNAFYHEYESGYESVPLGMGNTATVEFYLVPLMLNCTISGVVFDVETEELVGGAIVYFYNVQTNEIIFWHSEMDGTYLKNLTPGRYITIAWKGNYQEYMSQPYTLRDGDDIIRDIPLKKYPSGVQGYITDTDGNPVEGAFVSVDTNDQGWCGANYTDENGFYEIRVPSGEYEYGVNADGYRPYEENIIIEQGVVHDKDVVLKNAPIMDATHKIILSIHSALGNI